MFKYNFWFKHPNNSCIEHARMHDWVAFWMNKEIFGMLCKTELSHNYKVSCLRPKNTVLTRERLLACYILDKSLWYNWFWGKKNSMRQNYNIDITLISLNNETCSWLTFCGKVWLDCLQCWTKINSTVKCPAVTMATHTMPKPSEYGRNQLQNGCYGIKARNFENLQKVKIALLQKQLTFYD